MKIAKAQFEWGKGSVQKQEAVDKQKELEEIAAEPFARTADDPKLERMRKEALRDGDPMAQYIMEKKTKESTVASTGGRAAKPSKPIYKGPAAPPNRFGILPGYRWDAIDRGNKFEHKVLVRGSEKVSRHEDEHRWSSADM